MKKTYVIILIVGIVIIGLVIYITTRSSKNTATTTYRSNNQQSKSINTNKSDVVESNTAATETSETPKADVSTKFNLGTGNFEARTVNARKGQQVSLGFEASFEDEVRIDEYDIKNIYVLPLSEETIQFAADKAGEFRIYLVKRNKTIGTLKVK